MILIAILICVYVFFVCVQYSTSSPIGFLWQNIPKICQIATKAWILCALELVWSEINSSLFLRPWIRCSEEVIGKQANYDILFHALKKWCNSMRIQSPCWLVSNKSWSQSAWQRARTTNQIIKNNNKHFADLLDVTYVIFMQSFSLQKPERLIKSNAQAAIMPVSSFN